MPVSQNTIEAFRRRMESIIAEHGHFVQSVVDGDDSFAYTIGRNSNSKPEFFMTTPACRLVSLLNTIPAMFDSGEIALNTPFTHPDYVLKSTGEKSRIMVTGTSDEEIDTMIGAMNRAKRRGEILIRPLKIILPDENNILPLELEDSSVRKKEFTLDAAKARSIFARSGVYEFTTLPELYKYIESRAENGVSSSVVYFDSRSDEQMAVSDLKERGFSVFQSPIQRGKIHIDIFKPVMLTE